MQFYCGKLLIFLLKWRFMRAFSLWKAVIWLKFFPNESMVSDLKQFSKMVFMKKILLTVIVISSFNVLMAQHAEFGIKGGVNFATLNGDDNNVSNRTSFHLGGLAHIHLSKEFAIQPELMYSGQGANFSGGDIKLSYINLPVIAQYMFGEGFRIQTGPQFGLLTGAKVGNSEAKDSFNGFDLSWSFGAGWLSPSGLGIDARYNLGLTDISDNSSNVKNSVWQLGLFYQFRKK